MANPSITLTSYNMGDSATEADYDSFIAHVCDGIDALCGFDVEVDSGPFGRGPASDAFDGTDEQIETMRDAMRDLWDSWCAEPAADEPTITNATIEALATDSAEHGDLLQTAICYRALGWDKSLASTALDADERAKVDAMTTAAARAACERVIADARAQADA